MRMEIAALMLLALSSIPALAADRGDYDGVYVARPTGAGCEEVNRDFSLVLEGGQAHMVYSAASGSQLTGGVNSRGVVHIAGAIGTNQATLDGQVTADGVSAILKTPKGAACPVAYARSGGSAAPTTNSVANFDGVYVGATLDTGVCRDTFRDYALVIEDGDARLLYSMRNGFQINGKVTQQGAITMTGTTSSGQIKFVGQIDGKTLRGTSTGIGVGATCETSWSFNRKD